MFGSKLVELFFRGFLLEEVYHWKPMPNPQPPNPA